MTQCHLQYFDTFKQISQAGCSNYTNKGYTVCLKKTCLWQESTCLKDQLVSYNIYILWYQLHLPIIKETMPVKVHIFMCIYRCLPLQDVQHCIKGGGQPFIKTKVHTSHLFVKYILMKLWPQYSFIPCYCLLEIKFLEKYNRILLTYTLERIIYTHWK